MIALCFLGSKDIYIYNVLSVCLWSFFIAFEPLCRCFCCPNYITISFEARPTSNYLPVPILGNVFSSQWSGQLLGRVCCLINLMLSGRGSEKDSGARPWGKSCFSHSLTHMNWSTCFSSLFCPLRICLKQWRPHWLLTELCGLRHRKYLEDDLERQYMLPEVFKLHKQTALPSFALGILFLLDILKILG